MGREDRTAARWTRREALERGAAALAGVASPAFKMWAADQAAAGAGSVTGWPWWVQPDLGVALQQPPGWTVRTLENGVTSVAEGKDGLTGARAYGQFLILNQRTNSGPLAAVIAQYLALSLDGMRTTAPIPVSASPDISAVRYALPYVDGQRKGTLLVAVAGPAAIFLGLDAPAATYASRVETLSNILGTFRWFQPSLNFRQDTESQEGAFSVLIPSGWRPGLSVIRPSIGAGFVATAKDPTGLVSIELHRPYPPGFAAPTPMLREGTWYDIGSRWGIQPLLVSRYLPGVEYIRSFLLPLGRRTRPGLQLTGWGNRPDLALGPEGTASRNIGGTPSGGEAEYTWTGTGGIRMQGRVVVLTANLPPAGGASMLWGVPFLLLAEAPAPQLPYALSALIIMSSSFRLNVKWYAGELRTAAQRWRIIMTSERRAFQTYEEVLTHRQQATLDALDKWDGYIRGPQEVSPNSVPAGPDSVKTPDGKTHPVTGLNGQTVGDYLKKGGKLVQW